MRWKKDMIGWILAVTLLMPWPIRDAKAAVPSCEGADRVSFNFIGTETGEQYPVMICSYGDSVVVMEADGRVVAYTENATEECWTMIMDMSMAASEDKNSVLKRPENWGVTPNWKTFNSCE